MTEALSSPAGEKPLPKPGDPEGLLSWVSSVDHKQIGIMYLLATLVFFLVGGVEVEAMLAWRAISL